MSKNPAKDIRDVLAGDSSLSLSAGTNLFLGQFLGDNPNTPTNSVFLHGLPGSEPVRVMGQSVEHRIAVVAIEVRWDRFGTGDAKIRAITDVLQGADISGYLDIVATSSEPMYNGRDANGAHMWRQGYEIRYEEPK